MHIAVIQLALNEGEDRRRRLERVEAILEEMRRKTPRPNLVLLPELWATGFFNFDRYREESEAIQGELFARLSPLAASLETYLLAGSIVEKAGTRFFNTAPLIGPSGKLVAAYRKVHLFGYRSKEREILTPGKEICVAETGLGRWGISICYDLRFPELYRRLVDRGAEILLVVSAWPEARLEHWRLLNRVRALENQCWLVSCNCAGSLGGHALAGHSMVVDPWGEVRLEGGNREAILHYDLDLEMVYRVRRDFPVLNDRVLPSGN